jgi:hypothetical protein
MALTGREKGTLMIDGRRTQTVQLGCGTLIVIALIVLFFSNGRVNSDLESEIHGLRREVGELKKAIEVQSLHIQLLQEKVDRAKDKE